MWNLLKSELTRFRSLAIGFAVAHFLLLRGISALSDLFVPSAAKLIPGLLLYSLCGLLLGLYQLGSYKKINRWTYLIHRPQRPLSILLSISGAAAGLLLLVVAVPWWLVAATLDGFTAQWVDSRHYLMGLFLLGISFAFYLVGAYVALSKSRCSSVGSGSSDVLPALERLGLVDLCHAASGHHCSGVPCPLSLQTRLDDPRPASDFDRGQRTGAAAHLSSGRRPVQHDGLQRPIDNPTPRYQGFRCPRMERIFPTWDLRARRLQAG